MKTILRSDYIEALDLRRGNGLVKVITGMRRVGKSFLLFDLFTNHLLSDGVDEAHIIQIPLDDPRNAQYRDPVALLNFIESRMHDDGMHYVFLDEIQMVPNFSEALNGLLRKRNVDVYATGSNSKFLSSDILTEFRGRGDEVHVWPLSFSEFMSVYEGDMYQGWADYTVYGGLPLVVAMPQPKQKVAYLKQLFKETYLKDITARHRIRYPAELDALLDVLASAVGSLTSPHKLSETFHSVWKSKISINTLTTYIGYLEDAFLVREAKRFNVRGRKYIGSPIKYYFEDVGLRNARIGFRQTEENHIMENVIFNELCRRGFSVDVGVVEIRKNVDGRVTSGALEIDFIAREASHCYYIQSAWRMDDPAKNEQEKRPLTSVRGDFNRRIILVRDVVRPQFDENGILVMSIFDFLLKPDALNF